MRFQENIQQRLTGRHKKCMQLCDVKDKKILDIGCSFGWFEKFAVDNECKEIIGIDTDEKGLLNAKNQITDKKVKFLKGSALNLSIFKKNYFDIVVMWEILEHLAKGTEGRALQEINRVLKSGGIFYLSTPNKTFWSCILDPAWYFGHRHYSLGQIKSLLQNNVFVINDVKYGGGLYELFGMILLYIFKWGCKREMPLKQWFDKKREKEYLQDENGFATLFIGGGKSE